MKEKENCALRPPKSARGGKRKLTANQNEQWEYRSFFTVTSTLSEDLKTLNHLGAEGWEAYFVIVDDGICRDIITRYFLKRRIKKGGLR